MANSGEKLPEVKHLYQNWVMDSTRWIIFTPRADDIVVATAVKPVRPGPRKSSEI